MNLIDLDAIQDVRTYPCVSVLITTEPGAAMAPADRDRLDALIDQAARRLRRELTPDEAGALLGRLAALADEHARRAQHRALALFVNEHLDWATVLAVPVRDRVVVDNTFATRDLVEHVNRTDPFWLLTLSERRASLYLGNLDRVVQIDGGPFPVVNEPGALERSRDDFLREVAAALDDELDGDMVPLVLAAVDTTAAAFQRLSGRRVLGRVAGNHDRTSLVELHRRAWPIVERVIAARQSVALGELDRARSHRLLATGIEEVWSLALDGRVSLVVAERGYELPVRLGERPGDLEPAEDREHPDVVDDLVDDLVETVLAKGGRAVFVDDGILARDGRVAAVLRY